MNIAPVYVRPVVIIHACLLAAAASADPLAPLAGAIAEGQSAFALRYRYEQVDQDGIAEEAQASTLRTRFTWKSGAIDGVDFGFEADYVSVIGAEQYNSTSNGKTGYPVVADPDGFDLNQAYVAYRGEGTTVTAGRQRILLGGQRFVGGVGWRQNEQTYDAARLLLTPMDGLSVDYAYVANVNRIFGPDDGAQPADWRSDTHLLSGSYALAGGWKVGAFAYLMDFDNDNGVINSNATYGLEATGSIGPVSLSAAAARQTDYASSPLDYRADYLQLEAALKLEPVTLTAGWELLGSDDGAASFRTPLATLHKFQGWADTFLTTPADGIRDVYAGVAGKAGSFSLAATYHDFDADQGSADYGSELDLAVSYAFTPKASAELKYADYDADDFATDTTKIWLTLSLSL